MAKTYIPCNSCNETHKYKKGGTVTRQYEKFLKDKLASGSTIDELVAQKLGTREGLAKYAPSTPAPIPASTSSNPVVTNVPRTTRSVPSKITAPSSAPVNQEVGTATNFYSSAQDKADYQKKLTELYSKVINKSAVPYMRPDRAKFSENGIPLTTDHNTCIDAVTGLQVACGKPTKERYISNTKFSDNVNKGAEDFYRVNGNFQVGDIFQGLDDKGKPYDAKIVMNVDKSGDEPRYKIVGTFGGSEFGERDLTEAQIKQKIKEKYYMVSRPGKSLDKAAIAEGRIVDPLAKQALEDRNALIKHETAQASPYKYKIPEDAKDYNKGTKKVMDKFVAFANDDAEINRLVEKTGRSKAQIHDSLLNTFGILGQENDFSSWGKGIGSKAENLVERIFAPKGKSIGQGQIKYNSLPKKMREQYHIDGPRDLYDMNKILPLMVGMDLNNRKTLENWSAEGTLSKNLFQKDDPNLKFEDIPQAARYIPYLRNQYSPIAQDKTKSDTFKNNFGLDKLPYVKTDYEENTGQMQYRVEQGSYPYKVRQKWMDNLERRITKPSHLYPGQVPEEQDYNQLEMQPVTVVASKKAKKKMQEGGEISAMGYRDDSPYKNRKSIKIKTPNGLIDMSATGTPLMANGRYLPPYSGMHQFDTNEVLETPIDMNKYNIPQRKGWHQMPDGTWMKDSDMQYQNGGGFNKRIDPSQVPAYQNQGFLPSPTNPNMFIRNRQGAMQAGVGTTANPTANPNGPKMSNEAWKQFVANRSLQNQRSSSDTVYTQPQAPVAPQAPQIQPNAGRNYENMWTNNNRVMGGVRTEVRGGADNTKANVLGYKDATYFQPMNDLAQPQGPEFPINRSEIFDNNRRLLPNGQRALDSSRNAYMDRMNMAKRPFKFGGKFR